ncbi:MAG: uroporphyrinogen-III synthase [Saprospiraceae bacterium]|nr:uroporphyrinogen-III synthase [Saprospiraceae bacterium]MDW8484409.1 uroporphyrinogen-III synthase [Saprospiraceae bacterium]
MSAPAIPAPEETYKRVYNILISQAAPSPIQRQPYEELEKRYGVRIDFVPFVQIEGLTEKEYRKNRIYPHDYTAIVFTSRTAVDHFFRLCGELRIKMSEETRYFCATEAIANYLQKFINFRKRRVFSGERSIADLRPYILRHKGERFFLPCSDQGNPEVTQLFAEMKIPIQEAVMYRTVNTDLSGLKDIKYDIIAFFSALEIKSMFDQFPDFKQEDRRICVFGKAAQKAVEESGLKVNILAGTPEAPSIAVALENYLKISNKDVVNNGAR